MFIVKNINKKPEILCCFHIMLRMPSGSRGKIFPVLRDTDGPCLLLTGVADTDMTFICLELPACPTTKSQKTHEDHCLGGFALGCLAYGKHPDNVRE